MELYQERGFDQTTVADIAVRAELTERTFFRYFADKREVLFGGSDALRQLLVATIGEAPTASSPLDVVAAALESTSPVFEERRDFARKRRAIIAAHAELQERELIKFASLASAMKEALRERGVASSIASLAADAGIAVFRSAFQRWLDDAKKRDIGYHVREALRELKTVAAGEPERRSSSRVQARRPPAEPRRRGPHVS